MNYGIDIWGNNNFFIEDGKVIINYGNQPAILDIVEDIKEKGFQGPINIRFPHIIRKQINTIYSSFNRAIKEFNYNGKFQAVFPLKVNQFPNFVKPLTKIAKKFNYGLEAGSKAELVLAMSYNDISAPITVNGFKDKDMISLCYIASKIGYNITITIEGLNELKYIIEASKEYGEPFVNIGIRIKLHSGGSGIWAKSGGINSKFGLTSTEILKAIEILKENQLLHKITMIHFHIGSQIDDIAPIKKAIREAGNIYGELIKLGALNLNSINLGGGLAVEYSQKTTHRDRNYTINEFSNDVVFLLKEISDRKEVPAPNIFIESGRFIAAGSGVLITPIIELFSQEYNEKQLKLKEENPPLIVELNDLYKNITSSNFIEYFHDTLDHFESLLTLFDLGYIDLIDRNNTEVLMHLIIKKALKFATIGGFKNKELQSLNNKIQEKYLANFSIFQSLPDFWGLGQRFPVMPIHKLNQTPNRSATIWDITCDSDGEIEFSKDDPLYLHDVDLDKEDYYLGFFLVGAYQEVLGMRHNLFTFTNEATVSFDEDGNYFIENLTPTQTLNDILIDIDYDIDEINRNLKKMIETSDFIEEKEKNKILGKLFLHLNDTVYLK